MQLDRRVIGNARWEYLLVLYRIFASEPSGFCLPKTHFQLAPRQSPRLMELCELLWRMSGNPGGISAFQTETLFRCILEELFVSVRNQSNDGEQALFEHITAYIDEHYMEALTVSALAEQNNLNENRLFYVFKKYSGMGPGRYLMTYRLNRAKDCLASSDSPIGEVANTVGYTDALYFSRIFKKHLVFPPVRSETDSGIIHMDFRMAPFIYDTCFAKLIFSRASQGIRRI